MLDLGHFPSAPRVDVFATPSAATLPPSQSVGTWNSWVKPRGITMVHILCIGGGGGGGAGFTRSAGNNGGGGGGGGGSSQTSLLIPAAFLPDVLFVQVGQGGAGGASSGNAGVAGIVSTVSIAPSELLVDFNIVCRSGTTGAGLGAAGPQNSGGSAGGGGTIPTIANMPLAGAGIFQTYIGGQASGGGAAGNVGNLVTIALNGAICLGGCGGAGVMSTDKVGGAYDPVVESKLSEDRPAGAAAGSNDGSPGTQLWIPGNLLYFFGGSGGSSSDGGVGGRGGNGGFGAGGGGGGAGTTGGRGGDGGSGLVVFTCW